GVDQVSHWRTALVHLEYLAGRDPVSMQESRRASGGYQSIPQFHQLLRHECDGPLVVVADAQEYVTRRGQGLARTQVRLRKRPAEIEIATHDLAGGLHLRAQEGV